MSTFLIRSAITIIITIINRLIDHRDGSGPKERYKYLLCWWRESIKNYMNINLALCKNERRCWVGVLFLWLFIFPTSVICSLLFYDNVWEWEQSFHYPALIINPLWVYFHCIDCSGAIIIFNVSKKGQLDSMYSTVRLAIHVLYNPLLYHCPRCILPCWRAIIETEFKLFICYMYNCRPSCARGNVLASRSKVRGFKPGWGRWIFFRT